MSIHEKRATWMASAAWAFLILAPAAIAWAFPDTGLQPGKVAFFGFIVGAAVWFQAFFTADASEQYGFLSFAFLLSCTAMGAFVTLAGSSIATAGYGVGHDKVVVSDVAPLYFAGMLGSLASSLVAARVLKQNVEPSPAFRAFSVAFSSAIFIYYVALFLYSSRT